MTKEGDIFPGFCCPGFDWEVVLVLCSVWGRCHNPECDKNSCCPDDPDCPFVGVSHFDEEDLPR